MYKIYDSTGKERDAVWLEQKFGDVDVLDAQPGEAYVVQELREDEDPQRGPEVAAVIVAKVLNGNGDPVVNMPVAWWWPDVWKEDEAKASGRPAPYDWCLVGHTNDEGLVGFGMGGGGYYFVPGKGPHAVWVYNMHSELVEGLGMLGGTNHTHLNPTFIYSENGGGDCPGRDEMVAMLDEAAALLGKVRLGILCS